MEGIWEVELSADEMAALHKSAAAVDELTTVTKRLMAESAA